MVGGGRPLDQKLAVAVGRTGVDIDSWSLVLYIKYNIPETE
jgi:hypothetical protein